MELLITDQHSYRSEEPSGRKEAAALGSRDFPGMVPEEVMQALDGGRALAGGSPATLSFGSAEVPNFRRNERTQGNGPGSSSASSRATRDSPSEKG